MKTSRYLENRLDISLVPRLLISLVGYLIPWVTDQAVNRYDAQEDSWWANYFFHALIVK
jgi:hypothetical protein